MATYVTKGGKIELDLDTMRGVNAARRTEAFLFFDGVDITANMRPYLLSVDYVDNADGETDDLQIKLQDRDELWAEEWLADILEAASLPGSTSIRSYYDTTKKKDKKEEEVRQSNLRVQALIIQMNWKTDNKIETLDCGEFFLDEIAGSGPPNTVTLKCSSAPYRATLRQTQISRHWSNIRLSGIAQIIANNAGLRFMNLLRNDPWIDYSDQNKESDAKYLSRICQRFDVRLKFTSAAIVLYEGEPDTGAAPLEVFKRDTPLDESGERTNRTTVEGYDLRIGKAQDEYDSCKVSYVTPKGVTYSGWAYVEDYDPEREENLHLDLSIRCSSNLEAQQIAAYQLARHNRYAVTGSITLEGNMRIVGGVKVKLNGYGMWDGLWAVSSAKHTVDASSGYVTVADIRKLDE